jgi:hypothetical protein
MKSLEKVKEIVRVGREASSIARAEQRLEIKGGTSGRRLLEAELEEGVEISHPVIVVVSGDDIEEVQKIEKKIPRVMCHPASRFPLKGDLSREKLLFRSKVDVEREFLGRFTGYRACTVSESALGATSEFARDDSVLYTREINGENLLILEERIPPDKPTDRYVGNLKWKLGELVAIQCELPENVVVVPLVAPNSSEGYRRIAQFRTVIYSAIVAEGDWWNTIGSFTRGEEESEDCLVAALPFFAEARSRDELLSKAQGLTKGSFEVFSASNLELKPRGTMNLVAALWGPASPEELDDTLQEAVAYVKTGLLRQLGWEKPGDVGEAPLRMEAPRWRIAGLIGPFKLLAVRVGEEWLKVTANAA